MSTGCCPRAENLNVLSSLCLIHKSWRGITTSPDLTHLAYAAWPHIIIAFGEADFVLCCCCCCCKAWKSLSNTTRVVHMYMRLILFHDPTGTFGGDNDIV